MKAAQGAEIFFRREQGEWGPGWGAEAEAANAGCCGAKHSLARVPLSVPSVCCECAVVCCSGCGETEGERNPQPPCASPRDTWCTDMCDALVLCMCTNHSTQPLPPAPVQTHKPRTHTIIEAHPDVCECVAVLCSMQQGTAMGSNLVT